MYFAIYVICKFNYFIIELLKNGFHSFFSFFIQFGYLPKSMNSNLVMFFLFHEESP